MEKNMIGKYLRDLRRRRGMSQKELALALGVSKQTISNWEVGRKVPRMKAVEKIANIFGVSRNSILAGLPVEMLEQEGQDRLPGQPILLLHRLIPLIFLTSLFHYTISFEKASAPWIK